MEPRRGLRRSHRSRETELALIQESAEKGEDTPEKKRCLSGDGFVDQKFGDILGLVCVDASIPMPGSSLLPFEVCNTILEAPRAWTREVNKYCVHLHQTALFAY